MDCETDPKHQDYPAARDATVLSLDSFDFRFVLSQPTNRELSRFGSKVFVSRLIIAANVSGLVY